MSALLLALLPGKTSLLEGIHGWELRPTFRGPQLPRWMEKGSKVPTTAGGLQPSHLHTIRRAHSNKDHVVQRATDRRRGVIEDLHLAIEIFIEAVFDVVHKAARCLLSPLDTFRTLLRWFSSRRSSTKYGGLDASVATTTLAENDPTPTERKTSYQHSMNTDARTCRDVITELGYPYEAISVITADGYVLLLERIPSWVSNGVVGSPAFAAFDHGYDVFLGNFRGLVSREHVDKNISSRHLGGAAILMYVITRRIEEKPHRLSRLILLSPAGFHDDSTFVFTMVEYITLGLAPILAPLVPGFYIPTRFLRMLLNKLARDFHNNPAVGGLVQTLIGYVTGGDSSNWVGVIGLPHYNMNNMPGVSFRVGLHLAQMKHAGKFIMFDYGSAAANMEIYGSPEPLDLGEYYGLIDVPVDLVAGRKDKVILPSMVRKHYKLMKDSGLEVSFNEFEYAHLDFMFSHREELLAYVMSRLLLVAPAQKQKSLRLKKKDGQGNC
ncbi:hypothetical protein RJ639_003413 [Escallonia herrerae]|uniref:Partial AB-hydrolase lipase domain-containing protein n=1 Tax=Escallonia herrerae TaxID=1293975 RepID=A0AA88W1V2_9ASTE|nr:hypothetical protein RJ639_003413 [Escallonia herrerae]